jgi:hypothetical protein
MNLLAMLVIYSLGLVTTTVLGVTRRTARRVRDADVARAQAESARAESLAAVENARLRVEFVEGAHREAEAAVRRLASEVEGLRAERLVLLDRLGSTQREAGARLEVLAKIRERVEHPVYVAGDPLSNVHALPAKDNNRDTFPFYDAAKMYEKPSLTPRNYSSDGRSTT